MWQHPDNFQALVRFFVYLYVSVYCIHVCMYVCMYVPICFWLNVWLDEMRVPLRNFGVHCLAILLEIGLLVLIVLHILTLLLIHWASQCMLKTSSSKCNLWFTWLDIVFRGRIMLTTFVFLGLWQQLASWNQKQNTFKDNATLVSRPRSGGGEM